MFLSTILLPLFGLRVATAASKSVHFFVDTNFGLSSGHWVYRFSKAQFCDNLGIFDDKVSSAQWRGLPQTGRFPGNQALLAFYTDGNCTGAVRTWPTVERDFPVDFARNGIGKQASFFMLWHTSYKVEEVALDPTILSSAAV